MLILFTAEYEKAFAELQSLAWEPAIKYWVQVTTLLRWDVEKNTQIPDSVFWHKRKWYGINKDQSLWVRVLLGYILHRVAVHKEKDTKLMEVEYETLLCLYKASITVTNLSASQVTAIKHTRPREATVLYIHCPSPASSPRPRSLRITYPSVIVIKLGLI